MQFKIYAIYYRWKLCVHLQKRRCRRYNRPVIDYVKHILSVSLSLRRERHWSYLSCTPWYLHALEAICHTMECKRDSFNSASRRARETHWECVTLRLEVFGELLTWQTTRQSNWNKSFSPLPTFEWERRYRGRWLHKRASSLFNLKKIPFERGKLKIKIINKFTVL